MHSRLRYPSIVAIAVTTALAGAAARAAEEAKASMLEEVVVTAQKRAVSLQQVPFSVAAETADQIRASGAGNIVDLARNVSGLVITDLGPGQSQVAIRGISAGQVIRDQPGVKPAVGMYLDESSIAVALFTPDLDLFDLERLEVLRGPQGTLFGAGSETGTIRYITAQPKIGVLEGEYQLDLSKVKAGGEGGDVKAVMNFPIADTMALRVMVYDDELPGFIKGYGPNGSVSNDVNSGRKSGGRIALTWKPNDALSITPRFVAQRLVTDGFPRTDVYNLLGNPYTTTEPTVPLGDRTQYRQFREGINDEFKLYDLKINYDFGPAALTSITSYTNRDVLVTRDATQLTGSVTYQFGGTSADIRTDSPLLDHTALEAFSQEVRIASQGKNTFDWLVGGYFEEYHKHYGQDLPTSGYDAIVQRLLCKTYPATPCAGLSSADNGAPADTPFYSDLHYSFQQMAAFAEGTVHINDQWSATGGARLYSYNESRTLYFAGLFATATGPVPVPGSTRNAGVAPRAIVSWDVNNDVRVNLQASKGFRLGGINDPLNAAICTATDLATYGGHENFRPETAWNYELGAKMRFMDRRVSLNVAAFYTDIQGLQIPVDAGSCSSRVVLNAKAKSQGLEAELAARPTENWDFAVSATYADATLSQSVTDSSGTPIPGLLSGNRLATSPQLQAAASVGFTLPQALKGKWDYFANLTGQYVGSSYRSIGDEQPGYGTVPAGLFFHFGNPTISSFSFNNELDSYHLLNFRTGLRQGGLEFAVFVNNITDESAHLSLDVERGRRARVGYLTNQPRTYGLSVQQKF